MAELPEEVRALLSARNIVHLATLLPDGSPHSVAIWASTEGETVVFFTQETSRKARNLAADPRAALSVVDRENPYRTGWVRGRVIETRSGDPAMAVVDRISDQYVGHPFPIRTVTLYVLEVERAASMVLPFKEAQ
jgi:PPOX class probable F420-dependent enzyme